MNLLQAPAPKNRTTLGCPASQDEAKIFNVIVKWRIENDYSRDKAHFVRQCLHYALNGGNKAFILKLPTLQEIESLIPIDNSPEPTPEPENYNNNGE